MKHRRILYLSLFLVFLYQCKEPFIETPAYRILRNQSSYTLEVGFAADVDTTWFTLMPGDSLTTAGLCFAGQECTFPWPIAEANTRVFSTCVIFDQERKLTFLPQDCSEDRSFMPTSEFGYGNCGFQTIYYPEEIHYRFDITDDDYALADSLGN